MTDPTDRDRLESALYGALNSFQQSADWPQLRLAQIRHHLAEHLATELTFTPGITVQAATPAPKEVPLAALESARNGATMLDAWAETPQGRNFLAHALVQLARDGWLRTAPGEGFEVVGDPVDVPEPQDPAAAPAGPAPATDRGTLRRLGLMVDEYAAGAGTLTDKLRRVRDLHRETCPVAQGVILPPAAECSLCEVLDAPAAVLPAPTDQTAAVCICGHTEAQHFEDVCITEITGCDCGDFLAPEAAREVIDRWQKAAMRKTDQRAALAWFTEGVIERCPDHGCVEPVWADGCHCELVPLLRRLAGEAQQDGKSTAEKAYDLGLTDTDYRARSHAAAVATVRAAIPGMYAAVGFRLEDVLNEADAAQQDPTQDGEAKLPPMDPMHILGIGADDAVARPETAARCPDAFWLREPEKPHTWEQSPTRPHRPCPGVDEAQQGRETP